MYTNIVKNVTISLPDEVLETLRDRARADKLSLNAWLRKLLTSEAAADENPAKQILAVAEEIAVYAPKWKWNRDEAHER